MLDKKQIEKTLKEEYIWVCDNSKCQCQISVKMTPKEIMDRLYFSYSLVCPICSQSATMIKKE